MKNKIIEEDIRNICNDLKSYHSRFEGQTFLVTGGAGFLGKYLVLTLDYLNKNILNRPCKVIILDNYITGLKDSLEADDNIKFIEHDVTKPFNTDQKIDYLLHAAGIASPVFYRKYKIETIDVGTLGTKNMLELAKNKSVKSFMFFSSSEVYGDPHPDFVPTPETYRGNVSSIGSRSGYDESKRLGEAMSIAYYETYKVPVKIIRPFNIYGPGMRFDDYRVIPNFVTEALNGHKIPIHGEGNHTRSFCYVTDAVRGIFQVLFSEHNGEVFNIGSDEQEVMIESLALIIAELFDNKVQVNKVISTLDAYGKADPNRRAPDLTKIKNLVGYNVKVDLRTGLKRFIDWAKEEVSRVK